jgi:hypothetical protein
MDLLEYILEQRKDYYLTQLDNSKGYHFELIYYHGHLLEVFQKARRVEDVNMCEVD